MSACRSRLLKGLAAASLTLILTACGATTLSQQQIDAAARIGAAAAVIQIERQPEECGKAWPLLGRSVIVGADGWSVVRRYEAMITGEINVRQRRCYNFGEDLRTGLLEQPGPIVVKGASR